MRDRRGDGLLPLRQRRHRRPPRAGRARPRAGGDRRLGRPPRQRHAGDLLRRPDSVFFVSMHQWPFYPGSGGPDDQGDTTLNIPLPAGCGDEDYLRAFDHSSSPRCARSSPTWCSSPPASTRTRRSARVDERYRGRLPRARTSQRCARSAVRGGPRGRLQPDHAAEARRSRAGGFPRA